jgi:hypothetical protein
LNALRRINTKGFVLGVFLDIEGAFDNVAFKDIATAIRATKVDPATAQWIIKTDTNSYITINHKGAAINMIHQDQKRMPSGGYSKFISFLMEIGTW